MRNRQTRMHIFMNTIDDSLHSDVYKQQIRVSYSTNMQRHIQEIVELSIGLTVETSNTF